MQNNPTSNRRYWNIALLCAVMFALFTVQISFVRPVQAQESTPTPTDPIWLAFSAARTALEEKFSVDLQLVRRWDWEQAEFVNGIDDCLELENPNEARLLYFGWRFVITDLFGKQYEARTSFDRTIVVACDTVTTVAAAATPAPDGNLPPPVAGAAATGAFELGGHVLDLNASTVAAMRRAGMSWVKKQFQYTLGDDPSETAAAIQSARANGFKILLGISGVGPSNNELMRQQMSNLDEFIRQFSGYLAGVARLGPDAIEIWNEPNIDREWPAGQVSGANYTRMLAAAFNAIKSANANVLVISGAPAPTGFFGAAGCTPQGCNDDVFMTQMAQAGAGSYMDCVGLHYNEGIVSPNASSGDPRGNFPSYYFGSMLARGAGPFAGKPVCWTELGYLTPEGFGSPLPANFAWAQNTTVAQQAAWLAEAARLSATGGRVRLMIVWNVDFPFYTPTDPMGGYGMLRPGGACPACDTLGTVMRR
jgi:hypothetical protein